MWKVSWQICVAFLQESVRWVYRRFHRWCNSSWEDGRITSTKCTTNSCNMFFTKYSTSEKRRSATLLSSGPSTCAKTSLNTADQPLWIQQTFFLKKTCVCVSKKIRRYIQWTYGNKWCFSTTRQFYIALSLGINLD